MKKREDNPELRLYELLGVKTFRKFAFLLRDIIIFPIALITGNNWKEEKKENNKYASNYNIGVGNGVRDLKNYKIGILSNAAIHVFCLNRLIPILISIISGTSTLSLFSIINRVFLAVLNCYCLMLQRYNWVRINRTIMRMIPVEDKKRKKVIEEIKEADSLVNEHTYNIYGSKGKVNDETFDELLDKASLVQLKKCRDYIKSFQNTEEISEEEKYCDVNAVDLGKKHLVLKLK